MSTTDFLRVGNECNTYEDKAKFIKLLELLSKDDTMRQLEKKVTTCYKMVDVTSTLNEYGFKKLKYIFPNIDNIDNIHNSRRTLFSADIGGKRKSKKRHYKPIIKTKTTRNKTLRNKILKRRRSRKRERINRRKSRKINLQK